jgi:SAM-dependent methyltransferase
VNHEYIQFGCGLCAPPTWRNFDAGPAFWIEKNLPFLRKAVVRRGFPDYPPNIEYGDVVLGLPVEERSAQGVYCSHVLEHLALNEFRAALLHVLRYLKPGGVFRLVVPDLEFITNSYAASDRSDAAIAFMQAAHLGEPHRSRGVRDMARSLFGRSQHLTMWDYKGMAAELEQAGFVRIRRASCKDAGDSRFLDVEDPGRWENCLGMECFRPG